MWRHLRPPAPPHSLRPFHRSFWGTHDPQTRTAACRRNTPGSQLQRFQPRDIKRNSDKLEQCDDLGKVQARTHRHTQPELRLEPAAGFLDDAECTLFRLHFNESTTAGARAREILERLFSSVLLLCADESELRARKENDRTIEYLNDRVIGVLTNAN